MRHRNDPMLCQVGWLVDDWMSAKIRGRRRDHAPNFAEADRNETRIREVGNPQRDVDAFVDFAVPRFKRYFEQLSRDAKASAGLIRSRRGRVSAE